MINTYKLKFRALDGRLHTDRFEDKDHASARVFAKMAVKGGTIIQLALVDSETGVPLEILESKLTISDYYGRLINMIGDLPFMYRYFIGCVWVILVCAIIWCTLGLIMLLIQHGVGYAIVIAYVLISGFYFAKLLNLDK